MFVARADLKAERAIGLARGVEVADRMHNMVEASRHGSSSSQNRGIGK